MYTQFFGNYLLDRGVISTEELTKAMEKQATVHIKLGTLAIHEGLLTANEVDAIVAKQMQQDKKFGEIAIENGYLTPEQLDELLSAQKPDYLLLGQILIEEGKFTNSEFEELIADYQSQNEIYDLDSSDDQRTLVSRLLGSFCDFANDSTTQIAVDYLTLLFNNLVRFIGNDFTPLDPVLCKDGYPTNYCVSQQVTGKIFIQSALDMDEETAVVFASRFAKEEFSSFDEYVKASLEDFLNLHNGLFNVNMSNEQSIELSLDPPKVETGKVVEFESTTYLLPVIFPFGIIQFILAF